MLETSISNAGLMLLGAIDTSARDVPGVPAGVATLVLLGWAGSEPWSVFAASAEFVDGAADPLDRWTRRVVDDLAREVGATPLYPFGGPPWLPFQAWALRAGIARKSPIGLLIHPRYGLWHSYRAALAFVDPIAFPPQAAMPSPCDTCVDKPCLSACPVDAYTTAGFAVDACRTHLAKTNTPCRSDGCLARDACPVGHAWRSGAEQIRFHQSAFMRA